MRVLQIGADRSKRGILFPDSPASKRQEAYAAEFGELRIVGFSRKSDGATAYSHGNLHVYPTRSRSRWHYARDARRIARTLPKSDIVSAQDPFETGFTAWRVARRLGVPLHVQVHTDFLSPEYARHSILNRLRVLLAGFVLRRASRIRVVSENVKSAVMERYHPAAPITVLPIFADAQRIRGAAHPTIASRFSKFPTKLLVVARLELEKNVSLAIRAFAQSAPADACLIVVGGGSERARLQKLAEELKVSNRVYFEGEQDAAPYYAFTDLVLVPSRYEGYGLVIIEALSVGRPVLSTDVGIAREAGAIIAEPGQFTAALAQWFKSGPRVGKLENYPYKNFDEYVSAYCDDVAACTKNQ